MKNQKKKEKEKQPERRRRREVKENKEKRITDPKQQIGQSSNNYVFIFISKKINILSLDF